VFGAVFGAVFADVFYHRFCRRFCRRFCDRFRRRFSFARQAKPVEYLAELKKQLNFHVRMTLTSISATHFAV
jgi:hypothetical protein